MLNLIHQHKKRDPLLSIVCATFNHESYIEKCLNGFLIQKTNFPVEIIIHDDASTDKTKEIISQYEKMYPNLFQCIFQNQNQYQLGKKIFFDYCFPLAKGKYIAMCEGDDFWTDNNKLQTQVDFLEKNNDYSICFHEANILRHETYTLFNNYNTDKTFTYKDLTQKNFIATSSVMFRNYIKEFPRWLYEIPAGDWGLHFLNSQKGKIYYINKSMSTYRIHDKGVWQSLEPDVALLSGIKSMIVINREFNYEYNKDFVTGIINRLSRLSPQLLKSYNSYIVKNKHMSPYLLNTLNTEIDNYLSKQKNKNNMKTNFNDFISPILSKHNVDRYIVRKGIFDFIKSSAHLMQGTLLDVGCGQMPYKEFILSSNQKISNYIGLDFAQGKYADLKQPDLTWDGTSIPLDDASVDCAMATEVLEHCFNPSIVLQEIRRVLKPGGFFFFTTPFLWPLHDTPHDHYRYTPFALQQLLTDAGFTDLQIEAMGGWNAALAQMIGLWLKRAPMKESTRVQAAKDLLPFYKQLLATDKSPDDYASGPMITALSGIARRNEQFSNNYNFYINNKYVLNSQKKQNKRHVIITNIFPKISETFILSQIIGLIDLGVDIEIWAREQSTENIVHQDVLKYGLLEKTKFLKFPDKSNCIANNWLQEFINLNSIENIEQIASFHVHFGINFNALINLFSDTNTPVLVSFHGLDASQYIKQHGPNCYDFLFKRASLITTPSQIMKDILSNTGCDKNKIVIHRCGVDIHKFKPIPHEKNQNFNFLTVARLVEKKGLEYSLRAFASFKNTPNVFYKIIGEGPLKKTLISLCKELQIDSKVVFLGAKESSEVITEMQSAHAYILTSITASNGDQEGLPVTLIEAQACGLPVISSLHAGIPELVDNKKTGFLCAEKSINCIIKCMKILYEHSDIRKNLANNAKLMINDKYDIEKLNLNLATIYKSLEQSQK